MKHQALRAILLGAFLVSSSLNAQPLNDVQAQLASLRSDQPLRINVDVELRHRGSAPLHLNKNKKRGKAVVTYGSKGVEVLEQWWSGRSSRYSVWRKSNMEDEAPPLDFEQARDLIDPIGTIDLMLKDATLVSDQQVTWQGQPARLLVVRPGQPAPDHPTAKKSPEGVVPPLVTEAKLWLSQSGVPLAMERSADLRLGPALAATVDQTFTFQQVDGRVVADQVQETYSGKALAVLRSQDFKKMKVTVAH